MEFTYIKFVESYILCCDGITLFQKELIKKKKKKKKKNSIIRNEITYSLTLKVILFQLIKRHNNVNNVVSKTKNNEIPSIPNVKLIFKKGNQYT